MAGPMGKYLTSSLTKVLLDVALGDNYANAIAKKRGSDRTGVIAKLLILEKKKFLKRREKKSTNIITYGVNWQLISDLWCEYVDETHKDRLPEKGGKREFTGAKLKSHPKVVRFTELYFLALAVARVHDEYEKNLRDYFDFFTSEVMLTPVAGASLLSIANATNGLATSLLTYHGTQGNGLMVVGLLDNALANGYLDPSKGSALEFLKIERAKWKP